jgi:hypothetical protein
MGSMATEQRHGRSVPLSAWARPTERQADPALCLMRLPAEEDDTASDHIGTTRLADAFPEVVHALTCCQGLQPAFAQAQVHGRSVAGTSQARDPVAGVRSRGGISCKETLPRAATLLACCVSFPCWPGSQVPERTVLAAWVAAVRAEASAGAGAWRSTRGATISEAGRLRPGRRALVAVVRRDLGRCGRRRRGGLAEGG